MVGQRVFEDHALQLLDDLLLALTGKLCHIGQIDTGFFSDGERQCLTCRIHGRDRFRFADRALGENVRFSLQIPFFVQYLQRGQQAVAGILLERPLVRAAADDPVLRREVVVLFAELPLQESYFRVSAVIHLNVQQLLDSIADLDQAEHTFCRDGRQLHQIHAGVFAVKHSAVHVCEAEILYCRISGDRGIRVFLKIGIRQHHFPDRRFQMADCLMELIGKSGSRNGFHRHFLLAVLRVFGGELAQHHFGMLNEILVNAVSLWGFSKMHPFRLSQSCTVSFLEKQNVSNNTGICVPHKCIVRQPDSTDQIRTVGQILTRRFILLVHCAC